LSASVVVCGSITKWNIITVRWVVFYALILKWVLLDQA